MQLGLKIYGKSLLLLLLSIGLYFPVFAQFSFEVPKSANERILTYNSIQVEVSGKLALCSHSEKGHINLDIKGGTPPFTFRWNTNETTQNRTNLFAGTYTVEITDATGYKHVEKIIVQPPFPLILNPVEKKDASCGSGNDGSAKISVKIGRGEPYKVKWSNGLTNVWEANNLKPGTYTVTVIDKYNCDVTTSFEIGSASEGMSVSESITNSSCQGKNDGTISLSVSGGVGPYTYKWNTGASTKDVSNLKSGIYEVLIKDTKGCAFQGIYKVDEPKGMELKSNVLAPSCSSSENGQITLDINGGTAPYTYSWSNGKTGPEIKNLSAGTYQVKVTDASGCFIQQEFKLENQSALNLQLVQSKNLSCSGENDGEIEIKVTGAKGTVDITWSDGVKGSLSRKNLAAGTYEVKVTDESGCSSTKAVQVGQNESITARIESALEVNCDQGTVKGNAWVSFQGGKAPFKIKWSTGEVDKKEITFNQSGTLKVTITDALGCKVETEAKVDFPKAATQGGRLDFNYRKLVINAEPEVLTQEEILFESEIAPEFIAWEWNFGDGTVSSEKDPIHVFEKAGIYEVKLTGFDIYGCSSFETNRIQVATATEMVVIPNAFTPNGDGLNDTFLPKMKAITAFHMEVFNTWGERLFVESGLEARGWDGSYRGQILPAGNYLYKITYTNREGIQTTKSGGITLIR